MSRSPLDLFANKASGNPNQFARQRFYAALMFQPRVIGVVLAGILRFGASQGQS
jgi:hypothetical protein